jgi:DNA mismatch endonuclease (patch repair protein)
LNAPFAFDKCGYFILRKKKTSYNFEMADKHSKEVRSYNMSRIRSKNTGPEMLVRKCLFANGFRYRVHDKSLPGTPDIVLRKYNTIIFINGCFWHGHSKCKYFKIPATRTEWWAQKINRNREKDKESITKLKKLKWNIVVIYECQLKKNKFELTLEKLVDQLMRAE